ncbi:DnaJ/Hsp40 cysteine-rich domain superfamily protein [Striga asiatica]|uniref:DnaJ/Hsp40 cysteine-rich domain superfamily protein n=1 Tax=Striga asiatica TaxID=4170 RepID=A0A5A7QJW9_STRAF|nr:DnaJ/Hsp40 cysteine-rich domain superfamily protein [Striga asiatica]
MRPFGRTGHGIEQQLSEVWSLGLNVRPMAVRDFISNLVWALCEDSPGGCFSEAVAPSCRVIEFSGQSAALVESEGGFGVWRWLDRRRRVENIGLTDCCNLTAFLTAGGWWSSEDAGGMVSGSRETSRGSSEWSDSENLRGRRAKTALLTAGGRRSC